jgi:hypothetical protein
MKTEAKQYRVKVVCVRARKFFPGASQASENTSSGRFPVAITHAVQSLDIA